jgi:CSLREA domain-containing protein
MRKSTLKSRYGIPAPVWPLIVIAACLSVWHALPSGLQDEISPTAHAAAFTVNTADDHNDGACNAADCTLREAINAVNGGSGGDTISFSIPGAGVRTINLTSGLPTVNKTVTIDGTTQPGFSGTPLIELNGAGAGASVTGLGFNAQNCVVRGLIINRFNGYGINTDSFSGLSIQGNYLGTDSTGASAQGNGSGGVRINIGGVNVGGTTAAARNVISGNTGSGIDVVAGSGTTIQGNFIGTNAAGTAAVPNTINGVNISGGSATVGGTTAGAGNVISGNNSNTFPGGVGIYVNGGSGNQIQGNFIGTNAAGTGKIPNQFGIVIDGVANNVIGGTTAAARNIVSGNLVVGIEIVNAGATNNVVQGNYVGPDVTGAVALGNGNGVNGDGISVGQVGKGPSNVTIGGTAPGAGNVISGNSFEGLSLFNDLNGVNVQGNLIGTNAAGTASLGSQRVGIFINTTSPGATIIGGTSAGGRNIISGNEDGFDLNTQSTGTTIQGNYIGTDISGTIAVPNTSRGMFVSTNNTLIGGTIAGAGNVISGNGGDAIEFGNGVTGNLVQGNFIGLKADGVSALGNAANGVNIFTGASNNTVGGTAAGAGNRIAFNGRAGVAVDTGTGNSILSNSIFSNTGLGIDLTPTGVTANDACDADTGPNNLQNFPVLTLATAGAVNTTIQGTLNSTASTTFRIEFFANTSCDASGNGEGKTFLGATNVTTDGSCNANFSFSVPNAAINGSSITATATDPNNNTSEFSSCASLFGTVQFSSAAYSVSEGGKHVDTTITRFGDTSGAGSVSFATGDLAGTQNCNVAVGVASSRCDYEARLATVRFAPGETSKTITVFVVDDSYLEGPETFTVNLSNPSGVTLGATSTATVTIVDNDLATGPNPIDQTGFFVNLHYLDFLNREPDQPGFDFWTNEINVCGTNQPCIDAKRVNTSGSFFLSIEFQQTGYLVERLYKASYGDATGTSTLNGSHQLPVPIVRLNEFLLDTQEIGQGVIVGQGDWQTALENNKQNFAAQFVQRSRFTTAFPTSMTPAQFVDALNQNAGNALSASERTTAINLFGGAGNTTNLTARAQVLRQVADDQDLQNAEFNRAFVLMQYFGYLRRNPNDPQDTDYTGYEFWLNKLNQFNGNFINAEMVKAFITSIEYRQRVGP